ncbi:MAG TPA: amidohydrolase family protein [Acidimicrobiales bacterium]|nr:amidohydrolase family protein [Acidimicrobiales bacterium]
MDFQLFDADNHYYEAPDCFTRHGDETVRRYVRWVSEGKRRHLLFGDRQATGAGLGFNSVPNPTFEPIARPGAFHDTLKAFESGDQGKSTFAGRYGDLEPLSPVYQSREERLAAMDAQGVEKIFVFPTLGLTVEGFMAGDPEVMYKVMHAFNLWLDDDWGVNRDGRIYAPPVVPMLTVEGAVAELEWALSCGARVISIQPGPAYGRSPADTYFDPFWARVNEAGVLVAYHALGGPSDYDRTFAEMYGTSSDPAYTGMLRMAVCSFERPMMETAQSLILGNLFGRFPNIRAASIEMGGTWVPYLLHALDHSGPLLTRKVESFGTVLADRPSDVFKERFYVSPFPEEDVVGLVGLLGADHVLMGSDWPHPEGTPTPAAYAECLVGLPEKSVRRVMRDNALELVAA